MADSSKVPPPLQQKTLFWGLALLAKLWLILLALQLVT